MSAQAALGDFDIRIAVAQVVGREVGDARRRAGASHRATDRVVGELEQSPLRRAVIERAEHVQFLHQPFRHRTSLLDAAFASRGVLELRGEFRCGGRVWTRL